jgi:hypothetical protein
VEELLPGQRRDEETIGGSSKRATMENYCDSDEEAEDKDLDDEAGEYNIRATFWDHIFGAGHQVTT